MLNINNYILFGIKKENYTRIHNFLFAAHTQVVGEFHLDARVVVFTDGRLTDFSNVNATEQDGYCIPNNLV